MPSPRKIPPVVLGLLAGIVLSVGFWFGWHRSQPGAQLPPLAEYPGRPDAFKAALHQVHTAAIAAPDDAAKVRRLAILYQANRLYPEARACFLVIKNSAAGLTAQDHYFLADIHQNEGDLLAAQTDLRATLKLDPSYQPARLTLADVLFKSGQEDEAAKEYRTIMDHEANHPRASVGLARIDLQRGDDPAAISRLERLIAVHPESTAGAALFAQVLDRRGEAEKAAVMRQYSKQSPEAAPADPWLESLLFECYDVQRLSITFEEYYKTGKMTEAQPLLDRLKELDPQGPVTSMFTGVSHANGLQHVTAVREYYESLAKGGDPEKLAPLLVTSLLAMGKTDEAAKTMAEFYARMPESMPIINSYADVALKQGDERLGRELLEKVVQKQPYLYSANINLARILWGKGEREDAVKSLLRVAQAFPADITSRGLLGEYYLAKADSLSAVKFLAEALPHLPDKNPARDHLLELLGTAYVQAGSNEAGQGHLGEAAGYFEKAIGVAPAQPDAYVGLANVAVQLHQFRRAADALQKLAELQPDNPTVLLSLGDVCYQDGAHDEATRSWRKALQLVATADVDLRHAIDERLAGRISADTFK